MKTKRFFTFLIVLILTLSMTNIAFAEDATPPEEPPVAEEPVVDEPSAEEVVVEEAPPVAIEEVVEEVVMDEPVFAMVSAVAVESATVYLNPSHVGTTNSGFYPKGDCPTPPAGQEGWWGWHFILPGNENFTSLSVTFASAGTFTADPFPGVFVAHPDNSHAYIWTPTDDTLLGGSATFASDAKNPPDKFNLSHVCPGMADYEELTVSKTAVTSFTREHFWDIFKSVDPEAVYLYIDGSGDQTVTWTVDVTYKDYTDSDWNVSGVITVENTGTLDAVIAAVDDVLAGTVIDVNCGVTFPYTLPVGETLTCTYDEDGYVEGFNEVTVATERAEYFADKEIVWGDPTAEVNKTVTIEDSLYGELGTATAPDDAQFTYTKDFAWADYGADNCGNFSYNNTATIVETEQSASVVLNVYVQCYIYETAYAKGNNPTCFIPKFANWGWTNLITPNGGYEWPLWAAAGQCNTGKGMLVGTVSVTYVAGGYYRVTYNVAPPYIVKETHVYVGTNIFPKVLAGKKWVETVAPGQYTNIGPFVGQVYVIAHAVVGIPDPKFGP